MWKDGDETGAEKPRAVEVAACGEQRRAAVARGRLGFVEPRPIFLKSDVFV